VLAKTIGEIICFALSRYALKKCCVNILKRNEYFRILTKAVQHAPFKVSFFLRFSILMPLFVINFGSGLINISFIDYIVPAVTLGTMYSAIGVYSGTQLHNLEEMIHDTMSSNKVLF